MIDIHLYLGAHKTATTHVQGVLLANRARLLEFGVSLSAPEDVRKEWLPLFFKYCNNPGKRKDADFVTKLTSIAPQQGLWILTEENIVGVSNDFTVKPGMYPMAAQRLRMLTELFHGANIKLFFSVRSYDSFYRSAYSEVVRNRGYIPFEVFYDQARFSGNSWFEMAKSIQEVLPQQNIVLWRFEDFRGLVPRLVSEMTGIEDVQPLLDAYKPETTRPSLSQKTMDLLRDLHPVISRQESLALVERINKAYPVAAGYQTCLTFTLEQEAQLKNQYATDVKAIHSSFPDVNWLTPQTIEVVHT